MEKKHLNFGRSLIQQTSKKGSPYGVYFNKKFCVFQVRVQMWQGLLETI